MGVMFDVITIGTATRDVLLSGPSVRILKDPEHLKKIGFKTGEAECFALGAKLEVENPVFTTGGGAANAAVTFRRQGFKTAAFVRVGKDAQGDAIVENLKREKITPFAVRDEKVGTAYSTILLGPGGERTILVYRGASERLEPKEVPFSKLRATWAYIAPGTIKLPLMADIVKRLKERGTKIAMNPSRYYLESPGTYLKPLFKNLDIVIVNREEASLMTGVPYAREREIFHKFDEWVPGIAVVTDGARGAKVSDGTYLYAAGIFKEKKLVDRTGAGDAFGSGFVAGLMQKDDIHFAIRLGLANAASVVEAMGAEAGILTAKEFTSRRWQQYLNLDVDPL